MGWRDTIEGIGENAIRTWGRLRYVTAVATMVAVGSCRTVTWRRTVRAVLWSQAYFSGFNAIPFVAMLGTLVGISLVLQADLWLRELGQSDLFGPFLVWLIFRQVGPILINVVLIVRSGSSIAIELGNMQVNGEVRLLESQGIDPLTYLVIPRAVGLIVAALCLDLLFCTVAFVSGYGCSLMLGITNHSPFESLRTILQALHASDIVLAVAKCVIPALLTGVICSIGGLSVGTAPTAVPRAAARSLTRSLAALFLVSILIAVVSYVYL